ncbi:uncharacterized protein LOC127875206 [Dreissena polymorpha]|uniref:Sushi domain-containing protein n=1 Tax=Dreissena polymorpha TaxID=45954 RepID=A0A9D4R3W7_DREPO|nr:uncharacterized protein LOC127875206 [Dreissena polymorpha]KAH3853243.1 hypothetical protein DPMN_095766 [Dreissena polymorpha]
MNALLVAVLIFIGCDCSVITVITTSTCPVNNGSVANGDITSGCGNAVGTPCDYTCKVGFSKITEKVVCGTDSFWYPRIACQPMTTTTATTTTTKTTTPVCMTSANAIPYGSLDTSCVNPNAVSTCGFSCQPGYTQLQMTVTCGNDASWYPANPCQAQNVTTDTCVDRHIWLGDGSVECSALEIASTAGVHKRPAYWCNSYPLTYCCATCKRLREAGNFK